MALLGTFTLPGDAAAARAAVATPADGDTVSIGGVTHTYAAAGTTWTPALPSLTGGTGTGTGTGGGGGGGGGTRATGTALSTTGHLRNFTPADFAAIR